MFDFEGFFKFWMIIFIVALLIVFFMVQAVMLFKFFVSKDILQEAGILCVVIPAFTTGSIICNIKWDKILDRR